MKLHHMSVATLLAAGSTTALMAGGPMFDIGFDSLSNGEIVTNQISGVTISAMNPNRPFDLAITFDTLLNGTADGDLEGPSWAAGNLAAAGVELGNILILAENDIDMDGDGLIDSPDDEGSRPAGTIFIDLDEPAQTFGFDLIDIEADMDEGAGHVEFYMNGGLISSIDFSEFANAASVYYDPTVEYGNNSANRISPINPGALFDEVRFVMGGSGGIDNLTFEIPAPGALALLGVAALVGRRRRRA